MTKENNTYRTTLANNITNIRKLKNMTQEDLSILSGLKASAISQFENNRRSPCINNLMRLCDAFKCTPNDLLLEASPNND